MNWANDTWYGKDKLGHIIIGAMLSAAVYALGDFFFVNASLSVCLALGCGFCVSIVKEMHDRETTGFSYKDVIWGTLGNIIGVLLYY